MRHHRSFISSTPVLLATLGAIHATGCSSAPTESLGHTADAIVSPATEYTYSSQQSGPTRLQPSSSSFCALTWVQGALQDQVSDGIPDVTLDIDSTGYWQLHGNAIRPELTVVGHAMCAPWSAFAFPTGFGGVTQTMDVNVPPSTIVCTPPPPTPSGGCTDDPFECSWATGPGPQCAQSPAVVRTGLPAGANTFCTLSRVRGMFENQNEFLVVDGPTLTGGSATGVRWLAGPIWWNIFNENDKQGIDITDSWLHVEGSATCFARSSNAIVGVTTTDLKEADVASNRVIPLMSAQDGICYLTGVAAPFVNDLAHIEVENRNGSYVLTSNGPTGRATCIPYLQANLPPPTNCKGESYCADSNQFQCDPIWGNNPMTDQLLLERLTPGEDPAVDASWLVIQAVSPGAIGSTPQFFDGNQPPNATQGTYRACFAYGDRRSCSTSFTLPYSASACQVPVGGGGGGGGGGGLGGGTYGCGKKPCLD